MSKIFTVLIPHFRTPKITAYTVSQWLKHSNSDEVAIIVINNSVGDDSIRSLDRFRDKINIIHNITDKITSHGTAYDMAMPYVKTDYVICTESDAFPTKSFTGYYREVVDLDYDMAGSLLKLSGGEYIHPAGAIYKTSLWRDCKKYIDDCPYLYFPNMWETDFKYHTMVRKDFLDEFLDNPSLFLTLAPEYVGLSKEDVLAKAYYYSPISAPFHNGMGLNQESALTYGDRTIETDTAYAATNDYMGDNLIKRVGFEPGQSITYLAEAMGKNVGIIPTVTKWLPGREGQQQEYTFNEGGIKHLWGCTAYHGITNKDIEDITTFKTNQVNELYASEFGE